MAIRANYKHGLLMRFTVAAANTVREGVPVMFSGADVVECNSDDDLYIGVPVGADGTGITYTNGAFTAAAGDVVEVMMRGSPCVVPVRSTAAGMTAGVLVAPGAAGCVDVVAGGGAVLTNVVGQALETATADGELVGVNMGAGCATVTAA